MQALTGLPTLPKQSRLSSSTANTLCILPVRNRKSRRALHPQSRVLRLGQTLKSKRCLPRPVRFGPPRLGSSRKRSSSGSTEFLLRLLNRFALSGHSLGNPGSNVGQSLGAHLSLGLPCRLGGLRGA